MSVHDAAQAVDAARLAALLEHTRDGVVLADADRRIVYVSPSTEVLLGYQGDQMLGRRPAEYVHPEDLDAFARLLEGGALIEGGVALQCRLRHTDGRWRLFECTARNLMDDPRIRGTAVFLRDVTEQRRTELELLASEQRYRHLVDEAADIIFRADPEGRFTFVNPSGSRIMQYSEDELIGRHFTELVRGDYRARMMALYAQQRDEGIPTSYFEFPGVKKDGSEIWLGQHVQLLVEDGIFMGVQAVARDMTERIRLDEASHQAQTLEAIGSLAGGIAHDFNNLLATIQGNAELTLMKIDESNPARAELDQIVEASERAAVLVRQLLAFGRRQLLQPVALSVPDAVNSAARMVRSTLGQDIKVMTKCDPEVSRVRADPVQIEQVLVNLIINARDAMPEGGRITISASDVEITSRSRSELRIPLEDGRFVRMSVRDTGVGMPPDVQAKIFEPFFSTKKFGKGSGLGLSSVYGIVKQTGGHVAVSSTVGEGTTFDIYLPAVPEQAAAADAAGATA